MLERPSLTDHALRTAARLLGRLPEPAVRRLAGPAVSVEGVPLDPTVQVSLKVMNSSPGAHFETMPVAEARAVIEEEAWTFASSLQLPGIEEIDIPTRGGSVRARVYPGAGQDRPNGVLVYFHGGGWVLGSLASGDSVCRTLAARARVTVVSVDYRLAPEHPFPAGVNDCLDAFRWVRDHAATFGSTPDRVAVGGESAGGNTAAVVALDTRDDGGSGSGPAFQLLFFPVTDLSRKSRSYELFSDGFFLTEAQMDWYAEHYTSGGDSLADPRISPLLTDDLSDAAPAYVAVAGFDPLRDEGVAYASRLREAGVPVALVEHRHQIHGFVNACGVTREGLAAVHDAADHLLAALTSPTAPLASR
ncbi:acetyl esterase [Quadrisphaera granulorum]|uniref:Acetyl esterase n=1 Tax=Quadrisphaera granulorum TaxID=317664 RepID=A0A316AAG6_9ACTN|nr:alpha/beta hydrolase [Quadrisphaera granulorum]PWJ53854.1 acetyl esterase [Quadrisphaera granulorum]SZE96611.1 acetyl esterase [Quadrisphaera granulorum]